VSLDDRTLRGLQDWARGPGPGDVIADRYELHQRIGEGGMGGVYAAQDREEGRPVAVKIVQGGGDQDTARFEREVRSLEKVSHPAIVKCLAHGTHEGSRYLVMEYLRGVDLARRLLDTGPLDVGLAVDHVLQACVAVAEAHVLGIVHRDLKPSNLFIVERRDGTELVKVLDFGISKLTRPLDGASFALTATAESSVMGSIAYMSPEQIESSSRADARSDVWSLGVVLFELIAGSRPFEGDTAVAVAARIASSPPRSLHDAGTSVPPALSAVVARCLVKDPSARIADVASLAR